MTRIIFFSFLVLLMSSAVQAEEFVFLEKGTRYLANNQNRQKANRSRSKKRKREEAERQRLEERHDQFRQRMAEYTEQNKQRLADRKIIGIEYLFAGPSESSPQSMFGHALLRFVDSDKNPYNDIVLSFIADQTDYELSMFKGLFGGYDLNIELQTFGSFLQFYVLGEGRFIQRYILQSSPEMRQQLVDKIVNSEPNFQGLKYAFLWRNCATTSIRFLRSVGYFDAKQLAPSISPNLIPRYLTHMLAGFIRPVKINATYHYISEVADHFQVDVSNIANGGITIEMAQYVLDNYHPEVFAQLFLDLFIDDNKVREFFIDSVVELRGTHDLHASLRAYPRVFYELCSNQQCAESFVKAVKENYSLSSQRQIRSEVLGIYTMEGLAKFYPDEFGKIRSTPRSTESAVINNIHLIREAFLSERLK